MTNASANTLADALRQFKLLTPAQEKELEKFQDSFPDSKALAKALMQQGWITAFQVNYLLKGKGQELLLGSYVLLDRLGEGGMGQVYKARNWKLGKVVALKLIHKDRITNPDAVRRFKREVRAAASLNHPNVVAAYDAAEVAGTHSLVMEYVEAPDLARFVKEKGPLPVDRACDCIRQAALGLQHAYERGLVHRDIKPSNLLLTPRESAVKILDLGLARVDGAGSEDDRTATLTQNGLVIGTPDYVSPEQARQAHTADIRSDIYSLGCTFYFLLTGQVPFPGGSSVEKLMCHQLEEPQPVETIRRDVPAKVAAVVRRMMAKAPEKRFQTPAEVVAALSAPIRDTRAVAKSPRLRRWPLAVAAVILLLVGVGVVFWLASGGRTSGTTGQGPLVSEDSKVAPWRCRFSPERERQLREMGGTERSEQAVRKGLVWIVKHQQSDGSWTCKGYDAGYGGEFPVAATALGLLPLLAAGETTQAGQYQKNVADGVRWLMKDQEADGGYRSAGLKAIYENAMATTALCEAYGLSGDLQIKSAAQKSLNYLVKAQCPDGGWKYKPGDRQGDTSATGWVMEAFQSGQQAGLSVPQQTFEKAARFFDAVAVPTGYQYAPGPPAPNPSPACTAIGILARTQLGRSARDPRTAREVGWLMKTPPSSSLYYCYHAQQAMYHTGIQWQSWHAKVRDMLIEKQANDGSWSPAEGDSIGKAGGRLVVTSFSLLILESYYRHNPLYLESKR